MKTTRAPTYCPACNALNDAHTAAGHSAAPGEGDYAVCLYCAYVAIFTYANGSIQIRHPMPDARRKNRNGQEPATRGSTRSAGGTLGNRQGKTHGGKIVDLSKLSPKALAAAMKGGTAGWGQVASAVDHVRYAQPVRPTSRRQCHCGCGKRATHIGMANGCGLTRGCELAVQRWIKTGSIHPR